MNLKLVIFSDCPNAEPAQRLLMQAKLQFQTVLQDELPVAHRMRAYSSPTLLQGEKVIFGSQLTEGASGCTLRLPHLDELKRLLGR